MAAKGSCIDFMFLGPSPALPLDPLLSCPLKVIKCPVINPGSTNGDYVRKHAIVHITYWMLNSVIRNKEGYYLHATVCRIFTDKL